MGTLATAFRGVAASMGLARRLRPWARGQGPLLAGAWGAMLLEVALRLAEPWPLKVLFDSLLPPGAHAAPHLRHTPATPTLLAMCIGAMLVLASARALASWAATVGLALAGNRVLTRCRRDLFQHLLQLPLTYHMSVKRGDLLNRVVGDVGRVQEIAVTAILPFVTHATTLAGMLAVMLWMDYRLGLVALAVVPLFALLGGHLGRRIRGTAREQRRREGNMAGSAAESLGAIRVVQAYGLEHAVGASFERQNERSMLEGARGARLSAALERSTDILLAAAAAAIVWLGAQRALHGEASAGDLVVFLSYMRSAFRPVKDAAKFAGRLAKAVASGERILEVLDQVPSPSDGPDAADLTGPITSIEFSRVTFAYPTGRVALDGVSFALARGDRLVLVGHSGAGKSTILNLILRLHDPTGGQVRLNGRDLREWTIASARSRIAVVLQESVLLSATIRENIACAAPDATDDQIVRAARLAGAHEFIMALPQGYDTQVAERGESLSGGQRQRIAIARAAVREASVLLLDEPTAGLDHHAASRVRAALEAIARDRITILVAHDLSDVRSSDHVLLLDDGTVIEHGTHAALLCAGGRYADLARAQSSARDTEPLHALPG